MAPQPRLGHAGVGSVLVFAVPHAAYHLAHGSGAWLDAGLGASVGAYGRKQGSTDPRLTYNRFQCALGLLWLAEALGEDPDTVRLAIAAVEAGPARGASPCRAVREVIPGSHPPLAHPPGSSAGGPTPAPPSTVGDIAGGPRRSHPRSR